MTAVFVGGFLGAIEGSVLFSSLLLVESREGFVFGNVDTWITLIVIMGLICGGIIGAIIGALVALLHARGPAGFAIGIVVGLTCHSSFCRRFSWSS
jgi:hypothetical protein